MDRGTCIALNHAPCKLFFFPFRLLEGMDRMGERGLEKGEGVSLNVRGFKIASRLDVVV